MLLRWNLATRLVNIAGIDRGWSLGYRSHWYSSGWNGDFPHWNLGRSTATRLDVRRCRHAANHWLEMRAADSSPEQWSSTSV
ncbi:hypothetical protein DM860_015432 [Cuscuta australis]|uniref:Uncharacterized protein n=1 Tax=Cuscuta australis TaxID=267555 RepID=A0A328E6R7_9ASTE|nr:hypothetical protein DM860_015432 [Cuscuta australis]